MNLCFFVHIQRWVLIQSHMILEQWMWPHNRVSSLNCQDSHQMSPRAIALVFIILATSLSQQVFGQRYCYNQDRTINDKTEVCNQTVEHSQCCEFGATCLTNGLCFAPWDTSINAGACTDQYWKSPNCFQSCPRGIYIHLIYNTVSRHIDWYVH